VKIRFNVSIIPSWIKGDEGGLKKKLKKYLTNFGRGGIRLKKFNIIVMIFTKPTGERR
jgi:hypothetical protein